MVLLHSEKFGLGAQAPDFKLTSVDGKSYTLASFQDRKVLVVMFICAHCPYVQAVEDRIIQLQRDYAAQGVQLVGICANDPTDYPDDSKENLLKRWKAKGYGFPYLLDETQAVARIYGAVCTPEFYVYDSSRVLRYHGQLDDNWKEPGRVTRHDLREALDQLLAGKLPAKEQAPSMGCSIKWRQS